MKKILIIEDQEDILDDIKTLLTKEKYKVYTALNGTNGVLLAKTYCPDLIISDIMLPGIDGYSVYESINNNELTSHIPFIFLTAKVDRKDLRKGMELGADDYIFKPYDADELLAAINTRINKHESLKEKIIHTLKNSIAEKTNCKLNIDDNLFISHNKKSIAIKLADVVYVKAENQYSEIICSFGKTYVIRKPLKDWLEILPHNKFVRIHRSVICNLNFINSVTKQSNQNYSVSITNSTCLLEVSRTYKKAFMNKLKNN